MRYLRCKCGKREAWSTMSVPRCEGCETCGTTLDESPETHTAPIDHYWTGPFWEIDSKTGERWQAVRCTRCGFTEDLARLRTEGA